jgi:hypothetical protein
MKILLQELFESVMDEIENYFKDINAKYPENYNPKIY